MNARQTRPRLDNGRALRGDMASRRLMVQGVGSRSFDRPEDVVAWLGAVQAQD